MLADVYTPVGIYLRVRDRFRDTILLESTDYHSAENSFSFICINAVAGMEITSTSSLECKFPGEKPERIPIQDYETLKPYILRLKSGEQNLLWSTDIRWFAKSSGTTSDKSKFIYPFSDLGGNSNYAAVKKYVIGGTDDLGANAAQQHYPNDTYMMRLAELYLIYAEATIGNASSTTDATAVAYFNKVHTRAGLPEWLVTGSNPNGPLTLDVVLNERFKEFAMEGMTWYDEVSLHYWNPSKALGIINNQDRGLFYVVPDKMPDPTQWSIIKTSWYADRMAVANEGNFVIPIPAVELSQAPNLQAPPVDYK